MSVFSDRLKSLRGDEQLSSFAAQMGINRVQYAKYERGENVPKIDVLTKILQAHPVSAEWLLGLPERGGNHATANGAGAVANAGGKLTISTTPPSCAKCKYKKLADAFKAL